MSNHEIGLGRVLLADAVIVSVVFVDLIPYLVARDLGMPKDEAWLMLLAGIPLMVAAFWAVSNYLPWVFETYALTTGHAELAIESRNRSRLANVIAFLLVIAMFLAILLVPVFFRAWTLLPRPLPLAVITLALFLLSMLAGRLSIYLGVRASERFAAWRANRKRAQRRKSPEP